MIKDIKNECPFCGSRDTQLVYAGEEVFFVKCIGCGTTGPHKFSEATAIMAWNKRMMKESADKVVKNTEVQ